MVLLITGCRSGFGKLAAIEAARRGHHVYAGVRDIDTAGELLAEAEGLPLQAVQLDVTVPAERDEAVARMISDHGRVDGLINNAGVALGGYHEQIDEDELRKVLEVNVMGPWALTNAVLPHMRAQGSGTIVQISSISGRLALPGLGAYACSKFGLEGLSEALRHEVKPFGVRVVLIEPGPYKTDILGRNRTLCRRAYEQGPYTAYTAKAEELFNKIATTAGDPMDVAHKMIDVCEAKNPPLRVPMGPSAKVRVLLKRYGPWPLLELAIGRATSP
jgi:NAD(P)-dependent dehydrogenase (short-subunit alcohol dehydrogenase family)